MSQPLQRAVGDGAAVHDDQADHHDGGGLGEPHPHVDGKIRRGAEAFARLDPVQQAQQRHGGQHREHQRAPAQEDARADHRTHEQEVDRRAHRPIGHHREGGRGQHAQDHQRGHGFR